MDKTVRQIVGAHKDLFGEKPTVDKINAGFTNTVFAVADKYILKICHNAENEREFAVEIDFYLNNKDKSYVPRMFAFSKEKSKIPFHYIITEKLNAPSLYGVWHTFSEKQREKVVSRICGVMKDLHKNKGKPFDWSGYIKDLCKEHLAVLIRQKQLTDDEISLIRNAMEKFDLYLESGNFVLIHNDLHFDNIFYLNDEIKLIDYESSRFNPIDKELEIIYYMAEMPWMHANEENERFVKTEDYKTLIPYFKKHYPEIFEVKNLEKRIAIYRLRDALEQYGIYTNEEELRGGIIAAAKFITD
jgi:aminoglycoside phosphotransferase (APT) family kinase protein